jgi:diacylglycerol kinase family enzyme
LLVNPTSRRNRKHLDSIRQIAASCPGIHLCVTESSAEVSAGLAELATRPVDVLAISGGDGTVSRVLTHLIDETPFEKMPLIAILPGGTANMTAGDIGLRGSVTTTLQRLVDWQRDQSRASQVVRRAVLRVQRGAGLTPHYGLFFGAGAVVQGIEYTNENIHSRGLKSELSLGLGLARSMWGIARQDSRFVQPTSIGIGIDDDMVAEATDITLLVVSTLERLFLNIHPFWGEANGKSLQATIVNSPAKRLIRNMPALLRGRPNRHLTPDSGYRSYNLETISLSFDGPFTMDGEIMHARIEAGPVTVSNGGELSFLRL